MRQFKNSMCKLKGFDKFLEKLQEAGAAMETEGQKCFDKCSDILHEELKSKAQKAGLDDRLLNQMRRDQFHTGNIWFCEVGWKKDKPTTGNPLPDAYKVMFYNYGTPSRETKSGKNRGKIKKKGFIKKAKLAANNRNKKLQVEMLEEILGGLKK